MLVPLCCWDGEKELIGTKDRLSFKEKDMRYAILSVTAFTKNVHNKIMTVQAKLLSSLLI